MDGGREPSGNEATSGVALGQRSRDVLQKCSECGVRGRGRRRAPTAVERGAPLASTPPESTNLIAVSMDLGEVSWDLQ